MIALPSDFGICLIIVLIGWFVVNGIKSFSRFSRSGIPSDSIAANQKRKEYRRRNEEGYAAFLANPNVSENRKQQFLEKRRKRKREECIATIVGLLVILLIGTLIGLGLLYLFPTD